MKPPNILFLMSDEHRADLAGFAGNAVVRTPNLDRLAGSGAVFANAYCAAPVCSPGRQCMMSGTWPWNCDCRKFEDDIAPGSNTFAAHLARYGYYTACCGKLHHRRPDQMQGWIERINPDAKVSPRFRAAPIGGGKPPAKPESGLGKWSNEKEIRRAGIGLGPVEQNDRITLAGAKLFIENYFSDPWYDRPHGHQPLLLKVSFSVPHYPFLCAESRFTHYLNRVRPFTEQRSAHPILGRTQYGPDVQVDDRALRRATAAYYGLVETMDEMQGEILQALEQVGQDLDEWLIIYTSDHGEMLGQHGVWEKGTFYEGSARVPLVIRTPGMDRRRDVARNVNLIDLYATICEAAGIPVPEGIDSRSLLPLLEGRALEGENTTCCQHDGKRLMIRTDALKYLYFADAADPQDREVLFDLGTDPGETANALADPAHAAALARFRAKRTQIGY